MGCGVHWCADETLALLASLAAIRLVPAYLRARWAARHAHPNCRHGDGHKHG